MTAFDRAERASDRGRISSGKTSFFTWLRWLCITVTARDRLSASMPWSSSPAKSVKAKEAVLCSAPQRDLSTWPKTKV